MRASILTALLLAAGFAGPAGAEPDALRGGLRDAGRLDVIDGDTLALHVFGQRLRLRLVGIDAPEMDDGAAGVAARQALRLLIWSSGQADGWPDCRVLATDAYGRLVVDCLAPEIGSLSRAMVAGGHAKSWPHRYAGRLFDWPVEQLQALAEKRGLWACDAPSAQGWRRDCPAP